MQLEINTENKTITIKDKISIFDLLVFVTDLNLDINEWSVKVEPQIVTVKETPIPKLPDWTNPNLPWVNPYTTPIGTPPYIQPGITYPTDFPWKPNYYEVTCLM